MAFRDSSIRIFRCSDVYMVDDSLPFQLNICLASLVNLLGALVLTSFALPYLIPVIVILFVVYFAIQVSAVGEGNL